MTPAPDPHAPGPSAEARAGAALAAADAAQLTTTQDRQVHSRAVAATGLTIGIMVALTWGVAANDLPWAGIIVWAAQACWLVAIVTLSAWRENNSRSVPRHTRRTALLGVGASGVLLSAISWAVNIGDAPGVPPAMAVLAGGVVATPALVAARRIRSADAPGRRR